MLVNPDCLASAASIRYSYGTVDGQLTPGRTARSFLLGRCGCTVIRLFLRTYRLSGW